MQSLDKAFGATAQPVPGDCERPRCPTIWYLEAGYQTAPGARKRSLYTGQENEPQPISDDEQARQIVDGVRLAFCQPHVEAFFNFMLWDERALRGWQSGPFWADRTPKRSYAAFRRAFAEAKRGDVDCALVAARAAAPDPESLPSAEPAGTYADAPGISRAETAAIVVSALVAGLLGGWAVRRLLRG